MINRQVSQISRGESKDRGAGVDLLESLGPSSPPKKNRGNRRTQKERERKTPGYLVKKTISKRFQREGIKQTKPLGEILGYPAKFVWQYLCESWFRRYGRPLCLGQDQFNIDHIIPLSFAKKDSDTFHFLNHCRNLQLLTPEDNKAKGQLLPTKQQWDLIMKLRGDMGLDSPIFEKVVMTEAINHIRTCYMVFNKTKCAYVSSGMKLTANPKLYRAEHYAKSAISYHKRNYSHDESEYEIHEFNLTRTSITAFNP